MDEDGYLYIENMKIIEFNMDRITDFWYSKNKEKIEGYKYLIMLGLDRTSLNEIAKGDKYMEEYTKKVEELNDRNAFTSWITPEEDAEMILNTEKHISYDEGHNVGYGKGIDIGLEQGMKQEKGIIARNLLKVGLDIKVIMDATGLSKEQLEELK